MTGFEPGAIVGGYEILEEIGQGGMATVYRAHQLSMKRDVALKVLPPEFVRQTASLDRFKQEASIVARLEHRAIVPVHDYGEHEGVPYIVMRYMDGGSVDDLLSQGALPSEQALRILEQIAPALDYAHRENVLHRDLKPSNILLDANGDAYITDFGIARLLSNNSKPLTTSGVVGTPSYMSPEQAQGHTLDGRSDIYALGVVLFEMLAGSRPFEGETPYSVAVKHVTEPPPSICALNPALPRAVEPVIFKALEKTLTRRCQTAGELASGLRQALEPRPVPSGPPTMIQTEPSLTERLRAEAAQHTQEVYSLPDVPVPPLTYLRPRSPDIQVMAPYVPPPSRSYTGPLVRPRRHRPTRLAGWFTWAAAGVLVGSVLLAVMVGSIYYVLNDPGAATESPQEDYRATAIFKLTATQQGLLDAASDFVLSPTPPGLPTNTPRPTPPTARQSQVPGG